MTDPPDEKYDWATDSEPFYTFLGIYVAAFQWIEGKLDEILLLHAGYENWQQTQERLAGLSNHRRIAEVSVAAADEKRFPRISAHADWNDRVDKIVASLNAERERRNAILHSQYLLRGLEHGLAAIRSNRKRRNGELDFDTEEMNRGRMDSILAEVANLSFAVGQLHIQLIHWTPSDHPDSESGVGTVTK